MPEDTGFLKRSLKVRSGRRRKGRVSMLVGELLRRGDAFYGAMVEYDHGIGKRAAGTKHKAGHSNDGRARVKAHPFLRPAIDETKSQVAELVARQIGRAIDEEARK